MSKTRKNELLACLGLIFVTICWGLGFVFVKTSVDAMPPLYLLGFRFFTGGIILCLVFWKKMSAAGKDQIKHGLMIGVFLFTAMMFQTYGCKYTTAGKNAFLTTVYVILVPFFDRIFNGKKQRMRYFVAAVIGFWGIGLISLTGELSIELGDWLTLVCGVFYALQMILIARFAKDDDPIVLATVQFLETGALSFIIAPIVSGPLYAGMFSRDLVYGIAFLVIFPTIFGFGLQTVCQKYAPPAPAAIIMGMEAVIGAIASYFILGEVMTQKMIIGCVMLIAAMLMVEIDIIGYFYPDEYIENAYVIDYGKLYDEGKRAIIFDIDNTLVMHDHPPNDKSIDLLQMISEMGFKILFLSNNKEKRVKSFRDGSVESAMYLHKAGKPGIKGYRRAMEMMGSDEDSTVFIGDQLFTDIWGAKRAGIYNILVKPIDPKEEIQIVLKRKLEWFVISSYLRNRPDKPCPHMKKELNY